jgi:SAM-dependent methyltransferase
MTPESSPPEWFEDEAFWTDLEPFLFPPERMEAGAEEIEKVLALAPPDGRAALDLCCGPGRHSLALAQRGFQVTAVDRFPRHLEQARLSAVDEGLEIEFVQADMREFVRPGAFDLALNLFTSFGHFATQAEDLQALANIHVSLKSRGLLVMDLAGKEWCARVFQPTTSQRLGDGSILVERHEILDGWSRIRNEWILIRDGRAKTFDFEHSLYSGAELRAMLEGVGFEDVRICGGLDGRPHDAETQRLVAVARKGD